MVEFLSVGEKEIILSAVAGLICLVGKTNFVKVLWGSCAKTFCKGGFLKLEEYGLF